MVINLFFYTILILVVNIFFIKILKFSQKNFFIFYFLLSFFFLIYFSDNNFISYATYVCFFTSILIIYLEFYSLISRGFSINILMEIYKKEKLSKSNLIKAYSGNRGLKWLFLNRCEGIIKLKFIILKNKKIYLTKKKINILILNLLYFVNRLMNIKRI